MTIETAISNAVETSFNNLYIQFQSVVLVMLINVDQEFLFVFCISAAEVSWLTVNVIIASFAVVLSWGFKTMRMIFV